MLSNFINLAIIEMNEFTIFINISFDNLFFEH